ncbi:MAG: hypothetical protein U0840_28800 [Gemmataceae bacterium]
MPAGKAIILVVIGALVLATGLFAFVPSTRPPIVKAWFRKARGFAPATTPTEALDRFREAIKIRDYETAAEFCDKEYREQILKVAGGATKLGEAIDSLTHNMDKNGVVNPKTKYMLRLLEPFPKTFKVLSVKENGNTAVAFIGEDDIIPKLDSPVQQDFFTKHRHMLGALLPNEVGIAWDRVDLVKEGDVWKIVIPVTTRLRLSVDTLKDNATNYANAIYQVRDEVKNNPVTKEGVQSELERRLNESK